MTNKNLMIIAGEVSGDLHGAALVTGIKKIDPEINICGVGGDKMQAAGMELLYHLNRMAFLGFLEVVKHIPFIKSVQKKLIEEVKEKGIKTVVLIDYPGFNLSMAKKLNRLGVKIVYYISPQIWAWGGGRIKKIKKLVHKMLVVFPFEETLYRENDVNVEFVGHPLLERLSEFQFTDRQKFFENFDLDATKDILLLLPGSRNQEVKSIFPEMIMAAGEIAGEFNMQVVVACSSNIDENLLKDIGGGRELKILRDSTYNLLKYSKFGIIKSGTSTLEAGLFELPMVIVYKTSPLTYLIGKRLVKVNSIGMANIISGENVVPELIQDDVTSGKIYEQAKRILSDKNVYELIKQKLGRIKGKLGTEGASERAARSIYEVMNEV